MRRKEHEEEDGVDDGGGKVELRVSPTATILSPTLILPLSLQALLEFFEKVQDSPIFILYSSIGLLWTLARDFFKTRTKNTLRLAGLKAKVYTFMLYGMW